jgi:hypothetical protein
MQMIALLFRAVVAGYVLLRGYGVWTEARQWADTIQIKTVMGLGNIMEW